MMVTQAPSIAAAVRIVSSGVQENSVAFGSDVMRFKQAFPAMPTLARERNTVLSGISMARTSGRRKVRLGDAGCRSRVIIVLPRTPPAD
jgi:hypothetical protein